MDALDASQGAGEVVTAGAPVPQPGCDVVFIEHLDKHESVLARHRFTQLPLTIGTRYSAGHVVDGDSGARGQEVSVTLQRDEHGELQVVAEAGEPAFWAPGGSTRSWRVDPNQVFIVAGQRLRVRTPAYVREPSHADATQYRGVLARWSLLWTLPLALGAALLQTWLGDIDADKLSRYVNVAVSWLTMLVAWTSLWALVSRLTSRAWHFFAHFSLAALALFTLFALDYLFDSLAFAFNLAWVQRYDYVLVALTVGALVWGHLHRIMRVGSRPAAALGGGLAAVVFGLQALAFYNLSATLASTQTMSVMRPPALRVATGSAPEQFLRDVEALKGRAEASKPESPEGLDFSID